MGTACVLVRQLPLAECRPLWVGRPTSSQVVLLPKRPWTHYVTRATAFQSTIEAATMLWSCGGLCLEVRHTDIKIAQCSVWCSSSEYGTGGQGEVSYLRLLWLFHLWKFWTSIHISSFAACHTSARVQ